MVHRLYCFILLLCKNLFNKQVFSFILQGGSPIWLRPLGRFMLCLAMSASLAIAAESPESTLKIIPEGMVFVKGGCYMMGDNFGEGVADEKPAHKVCVNDFLLGEHEVSQGEWKNIMGRSVFSFGNCGDNCPVDNVSWYGTQEFIRKLNIKTGLNYRLPTEAEWEYAAREGGKKARFGTGKDTISPEEANFNGTPFFKKSYSQPGIYRIITTPKKSFLPNALGLYDMSGNVWEWAQDWYDKNYYRKSPRNNPQGPNSGEYKVLRGGSWGNTADGLRASNRHKDRPDSQRRMVIGFRLALDK